MSLALATATVVAMPARAQSQDQNGPYQRGDHDPVYQNDRISPENGQNGTYDQNRAYGDQDQDRDHQNDQDRDRQYSNDRDHDRQQYVNSEAYQRGLKEGIRDRERNRQAHPTNADQWTNRTDHDAYMAGYNDGFSGRDPNSGYRDHGGSDRDREPQR